MTREVIFYGGSDDLVEVEDPSGILTEEYNTYEPGWTGLLTDSENGDTAYVYLYYQNNGCWTATIGIYDESYKLPAWNPRIVVQHDYSTGLVLSLPETVSMKEVEQ